MNVVSAPPYQGVKPFDNNQLRQLQLHVYSMCWTPLLQPFNDHVRGWLWCQICTVFMLIECKVKKLRFVMVKVITRSIKIHYEKSQNANLIRSCVYSHKHGIIDYQSPQCLLGSYFIVYQVDAERKSNMYVHDIVIILLYTYKNAAISKYMYVHTHAH